MAIVCGTDFSDNAEHALRTAARFARSLDEPLVLVHVVEAGAVAGAVGAVEGWTAAAQGRLEELAAPLRNEALTVETRVLVGTPDERLAELADALGAALIVVAFLGQRSAERWRSGSVPARLARSALVPVVVVRDAADFEPAARGGAPVRALVAAGASRASDAAVGWLGALQALGPCAITLLHVYDPAWEWSRLGFSGRAPLEGSAEVEAILLRDLTARASPLLSDIEVTFSAIPSLDRVAATVARVAERGGFDVVVVGGYPRRGLHRIAHDSVSERLLALAPASVVRVPLGAPPSPSQEIPRMDHILVPTDLSELGNAAAQYAYAIATAGSTVHLLHVVEDAPLPNPLYAHYTPGRRTTAEERAGLELALRALIPEGAEERGIETQTHLVREGRPADVIRALAEREGVDAICMGTHGRSGLSRLFGGSVTREIADESPRPLLLVHPPAAD